MRYAIHIPPERMKEITPEFISQLESRLNVKIKMEREGAEIEGEGVEAFQALNVLRAVSCGFSPEEALLLLEENTTFQVIEIPGSKNNLTRIRARLIGRKGRVKRNIERYTGCKISIGERSVYIIGTFEKAEIAKTAIEMLISGKKHSTMYKYFERLRREGTLE